MNAACLNIVLAEDEAAHVEAIRRALEDSSLAVEIRVVGTLAEFRAAVAAKPPPIALVDLNLPDGRAVELLSTPLQDAPFPILIMTSHGNEQTAVEALKAGALDYVVKSPESFAGMPRSLARALREWGLIQERKLAREALVAAKEAAEGASRAKSEFLALMSHELRTPLNGVMGGVQMLRCTELSPEQGEYLELIMSSARNQLSLVNDILDLARADSDGLALEKEAFRLRESVNHTVKLQQADLDKKGLSLQVSFGSDLPDGVVGDALRFRQILLKMLANAVKFTEKGGITIELALVSRQGGEVVVRCSVADTGIGVAQEQADRIFAPFVQADMSATRKYGGSGVGLTICRRLTDALGGRIWFENNRGGGSIFSFELPLLLPCDPPAAVPADLAAVPAVLAAVHPLAVAKPRAHRVLVADDDETSISVIAGILSKLGNFVVTAANGKEALERWQDAGPFDAILMDVQMPVMSGLEALRAIRELEWEAGGHVPIIAQTAYAAKKDQAHLMAQGFDGYLPKPLIISDLIEQMKLLTGSAAHPKDLTVNSRREL
jgi:signal transduction histidine kinase